MNLGSLFIKNVLTIQFQLYLYSEKHLKNVLHIINVDHIHLGRFKKNKSIHKPAKSYDLKALIIISLLPSDSVFQKELLY